MFSCSCVRLCSESRTRDRLLPHIKYSAVALSVSSKIISLFKEVQLKHGKQNGAGWVTVCDDLRTGLGHAPFEFPRSPPNKAPRTQEHSTGIKNNTVRVISYERLSFETQHISFLKNIIKSSRSLKKIAHSLHSTKDHNGFQVCITS